jgi:menaquinol-cytochrome c reductase iron-sulfur subunit
MNRRTLLKTFVQIASLAVAAVVAIPGVAYVLSPVIGRKRDSLWLELGPADQFPPGQISEAIARLPEHPHNHPRERGVYVSRLDPQQLVVFSRSCTDVGCPVNWDAGSHCFFCPCHGGIFDSAGQRMAGPPPRPLHRYATRVRDGMLEIDFYSTPPMT